MPVVTELPQKVFVHCVNPHCPGMWEQEVPGVAVETAYLFTDNGGDIPGIERSTIRARALSDDDMVCEFCEGPREASLQPRPEYQALSGHDPMGLLAVSRYDAGKPVLQPGNDDAGRVAELEARLAAQDEKIDRLLSAVENQATGD